MIFDYLFQFLIAWATRTLHAWRRRRLVRRAQDWSQASGRGLRAQAKSSGDSPPAWTAEITYSYVVNGEYYSGWVSLPAEDERHAEGLALGWEDREILVRYSPADPTQSTLLLEDQNQQLKATPKI